MSKGENIFKRKDGRWEARYVKGRDPSDKIRHGYCYGKTYKEAKEKAEKCKAALLNGTPLPASGAGILFSVCCSEWLRIRKSRVKESTYVKYAAAIDKHIMPRLGSCRLCSFTTELADDFTGKLRFDGLAPKTVRDILSVLHSILKFVDAKYPHMLPPLEINYPKSARKEIRVLSRDEQERFAAYLLEDIDTCKFGVLLALLTGMRIGELCALRWESIPVQDGTVRIAETMQRLRDISADGGPRTRIVIGQPKSGTSARTIPLTDHAVDLCRRMRSENPAAYVLTGTERYMEPRTLQYRLAKYTRDCALDGVHFHTLRHTFATRAVEVGFEIKSLSEILGHAAVTITLDRYVHSSLALKRDNMKKLNAVGM